MIFDWRQFCDIHEYFDNSYEWSSGGAVFASGSSGKCFMLMMQ